MASTQNSQEILTDKVVYRSTEKDMEGGADDDRAKESEEKRPNILLRLIQYHYGDTKCVKSPEQIEREKNLVPCLPLPFNRWYLIPAAVIIQFCCGSLYAWSVFNQPIDKLIYGEVRNMAPITFYIAVGCFGISAALMGPWLERNGPFISCVIGTCLFVGGNFVSALALHLKLIWLLFIGYGLISGFGLGICYISPVSALQKWFPDKRGMASGLAVCGFGAGSIAIAKVQLPLFNSVGLPLTFIILGSFYAICMLTSAVVLRTPPPDFNTTNNNPNPNTSEEKPASVVNADDAENNKINLIDALTSNNYRFMYAMMLANSIFGLVVISRLANMTKDIFGRTEEEGSTVVSINGLFNLGGRLFFSVTSDFIGRKNCFFFMLTSQLIILGCFSTITTTQTYWAFLMTMWILTGCYGAGFGVIPAFLSDTFGPTNIGACHGVILTAWSFAGVAGGLIFTAIFNDQKDPTNPADPHPYNVNVWWIFGVVFIGWIALLFVTPTKRDKEFTRWPRKWLGRLCNRARSRVGSMEMN